MLCVVECVCNGLVDWDGDCVCGWVGMIIVVYGDGFEVLVWFGLIGYGCFVCCCEG